MPSKVTSPFANLIHRIHRRPRKKKSSKKRKKNYDDYCFSISFLLSGL